MNTLLWILQVLLALHTATGAIWKFSNPAQAISSISAIPPAVWLAMSVLELCCTVGLIVPALYRSVAIFVPIAAAAIAAEMLLFSGLHLASGTANHGPLFYWLVVAAFCSFIAYGRLVLRPL